jgi:membrane protease YdiL (CAAX protease family)
MIASTKADGPERLSTDLRPLAWLLFAYCPFFLNDFLFIRASDWKEYLAVDYGARLLVIAIVFASPTLRPLAFLRERLAIKISSALLLVIACIALERLSVVYLERPLARLFPGTIMSGFPALPPAIRNLDLALGMLLVAFSEELLCRRCAKFVLRRYLRSDLQVIAVSAMLFGAMHWSNGIGSVISITLIGAFLMRVYLDTGTVVPVIVAHYIIDVIAFW